MKNKYISFVALAAAALATSCASDDLAEQKQEQTDTRTVTLTASVNEGQTRVGMTKGDNNTASFYWHAKDAISVQTVKDNTYSGTEFTITGEDVKDGATSATFTADVTGMVGNYAVYPYNKSHKFTGATALTYNLPASYDYSTVGSNIFSKTENSTTTYPSNPTNMPMLGTIAEGKISFKCLGGLAVIRFEKMPAESGTLIVSADQQLSGDFTVEDLSADEAKIETQDATSNNTVSFTFSGATANGIGVFYLPLAVGDYTNVKVTINSTEVDCGRVSISRAGATAVSIATYEGTLTDYQNQTLRSYGSKKYYLGDGKYEINGHGFVDLGLDALWAETNVGANNAEGYGTYHDVNVALNWSNSDSYWGSSCSVPSQDEFKALINGCTWTWTTENGVNGYKVVCKTNNNSIFLPATGFYDNDGDNNKGSMGYYWSCTCYNTSGPWVYNLWFNNSGSKNCDDGTKNESLYIRPVAKL